jgi:hypothetical protein
MLYLPWFGLWCLICNLINYICKVIVIQLITFQNPCNGDGNLIEGFGQVMFYWWGKPPTCRKSLTNFIT